MTGEKRKLSLYVHTHWDREWYWAFERYRTMLLSVMKLVLNALENGELPNFHLDGQVCAIDDFLELEPSYEERIKQLNASSKLSIGPWYVLADQMLVGGESLVRNLEVGMARTRRLGSPMMVGYCPDTFGHSQDLPRILKGFGIENAVVWRGVPELDQGPEFIWRSPDGSEVIATCLAKGYHHTTFHEAEGVVNEARIDAIVQTILPWVDLKWDRERGVIVEDPRESRVFTREVSGCLLPVGGDHQKPPANLSKMIDAVEARLKVLLADTMSSAAKEAVSDIELEPVQLPDYLTMVAQTVQEPLNPLLLIEGELRENNSALNHAAGYMLPGVLSTRLYLKRANRELEHRLSRMVEPLSALMSLSGITRYPGVELDNCWRYMLKNHPHDSMCGCSVDDVHREMMTRFASVHHILDVLEQRLRQDIVVPGVSEWSHEQSKKLRGSAKPKIENAGFGRECISLCDPEIPLTGLAAFNLSLEETSAPVKFSIAVPPQYFTEDQGKTKDKSFSHAMKTMTAPRAKDRVELFTAANKFLSDIIGDINSFQIESGQFQTELFGASGGVPLYKDTNYVEGWIWSPHTAPLGVTKIVFEGSQVPKGVSLVSAPGSAGLQPAPKSTPTRVSPTSTNPPTSNLSIVEATSSSVSNGFFDIRVDKSGKISVTTKYSNGKNETYTLDHTFKDVADGGDSYNFDPVLNDSPIVANFKSAHMAKTGPLVGSINLTYTIKIPEALVEEPVPADWQSMEGGRELSNFSRSKTLIEHEITTEISLKRGVPLLFFETKWTNKSKDHRLEVIFNTGSPVNTTWSENHFSLVERKHSYATIDLPVVKYTEAPLDRFPCQRFFVANGQAFYNLGLPEYGVEGDTVSLTILRAISMLSRRRLLTRGGGAGPYIPVPDANSIGENHVSYAWAPLSVPPISSFSQTQTLSNDARALAYQLSSSFEGTLWATPLTAESTLAEFSISISNPRIHTVTLYSNDSGSSLLLRLLNVSLQKEEADLVLNNQNIKVSKVNLAGTHQHDLSSTSGKVQLTLRPNELITLRLTN